MLTKVQRQTLLLYELTVLPKNSRPKGMVEGSQAVTLLNVLTHFLGENLVRMNRLEATKLPTEHQSRQEEETGPVLWRVPCWRLQRFHRSCQHTCQDPEI